MTILPDFEQQLVDLAARTYGTNSHRRERSLLSRTIRALRGAIVPAAAEEGREMTTSMRRRSRLLAGLSLALAGLAAAVVVVAIAASSSTPPAYAVTRSGPGLVTITLRQIDATSSLDAKLAAIGSRIRVVPVVHGCVAPVHTVSNGQVVPGPAKTLEASPDGGAIISMTIENTTIAGRTFVIGMSKNGLRQIDTVVVDPAPACVGDNPAHPLPFLLPSGQPPRP
jgi:hypothetical protein